MSCSRLAISPLKLPRHEWTRLVEYRLDCGEPGISMASLHRADLVPLHSYRANLVPLHSADLQLVRRNEIWWSAGAGIE